MKKLKKENIIHIKNMNYNYLHKKKNLYENYILLNINTLKIIEFQNINLFLPKILNDKNILFTIQQIYNNSILLNYDMKYSILFLFHNYIIKKILQQKNKKIKTIFVIKQKKQIRNFFDFYKNQKKKELFFQENKYFFILFSYIFSVKYNNNFYFKIKNKKFILFNTIQKKKSNFFEKKKFFFFLLKEDNLKHKYITIYLKENKYILSRIQYLKKYLNI